MRPLAWVRLQAPFGALSAGCSGSGVARVRFGSATAGDVPADLPGADLPGADLPGAARAQLLEYLAGRRRAFSLPLDWASVPGEHRRVLSTLLESVGYGQTITYGELARRSGLADSERAGGELPARAVGRIMASNPIPVLVPCHRVLASDGLGGYSGGGGLETKRWLLMLEGALPPTLDWRPAQFPADPTPAGPA